MIHSTFASYVFAALYLHVARAVLYSVGVHCSLVLVVSGVGAVFGLLVGLSTVSALAAAHEPTSLLGRVLIWCCCGAWDAVLTQNSNPENTKIMESRCSESVTHHCRTCNHFVNDKKDAIYLLMPVSS